MNKMSDTVPPSAAGGRIMLVGLGPGSHEHLTARARAAIAEADTVIGYVTYIRLVAELLEGKEVIKKSMTEELDRAIEAYEQLYAHHRDRSDVLELLVRLYNAKKDYPKMLSTIDRMEQADGPSEEISLMRMGIYEQQGDKKNAYRILHALTRA